ncbi:MAG: PAS domain-containing protein [Woeseia sp.]|nr:PAS domain-containing protein [Woeseia sp.]MBT8096052.1 PAS domain-containing protein [Woeseia sp.]NNE61488.1 PAS domain-containing protein [Woeseia sp.]NNL54471.1 PAS domain-containing protein [Woeseia sp.]
MQNVPLDQTLSLGGASSGASRNALQSELTWRALGTLNVFRLLVALALLALFVAGGRQRIFGDSHPTLFVSTISAYLIFGMLCGVAVQQRWLTQTAQIAGQITLDIFAIVLLMHASGGISSGLGALLVVYVGAGSLLLPLQFPGFFAALATIAVLAEQLFSQLGTTNNTSNYSAAGVLGAIIFAIALSARPLAKRLQDSEALAHQRGVDLANLSELNQYIVQHLRESIVVIDDENRIRLINSSAEALFGLERRAAGMALGEASEELDRYLKRWREDPAESSHNELTVASDYHTVRISVHLAPLGRNVNRTGPVLLFLEDAGLINARVQQSKLASLGRLSASIAHEIRNPVGAMSHAGQLLAESSALSREDLRLTDIIRTHAERVSLIIENVLQLSRREPVEAQDFELRPWLDDFCEEFRETLELHAGQVKLHSVDPALSVNMDPSHLRQVMWNLCENAMRYGTKDGVIQFEIRAGRIARSNRPFVEVLDRGIGVDAALTEKIFEPFFTNQQAGTGLGLYISRELCELNHATLVYQPRDGGGSILRVVFSDTGRWQRLGSQDS